MVWKVMKTWKNKCEESDPKPELIESRIWIRMVEKQIFLFGIHAIATANKFD
jgi:hypothetical protein